jgi:hypothetical protein
MAFNDKIWDKPAVQGKVGALALTVSISLDQIVKALENLKNDKDISAQLTEIRSQSKKLDKMFDELTGYTSDVSR